MVSHSVEETEQAGFALASRLAGQDRIFVALYGGLGAGKTAFVRGFVEKFSPGSRVKSPTYTIVNEYRKGSRPVFHFDLYRIESEEELAGFGFEEYVDGGICIAEWCEKIPNELPPYAVKVKIAPDNAVRSPGETDNAVRTIQIENDVSME